MANERGQLDRIEHDVTVLTQQFRDLVLLVQGVAQHIDAVRRDVGNLSKDLEGLDKRLDNLVNATISGRTYDAERWRSLVHRIEKLEEPPSPQ